MKSLLLTLVAILFAIQLSAQPTTIIYQGKLLDNLDMPINLASVPITFAIYDASSTGTKLWPSGASASKTVDIDHGLYSVTLGTGTGSDDVFTAAMFVGTSPWLEVVVDGSTLPRTALTNVPFSLISNQLSTAGWASPGAIGSTVPNTGAFSGLTVGTGVTTYSLPNARGTNNQLLVTNGSGVVSWGNPSAAPSGAAGGDLSGSYPNPSIADGSINNIDINASAAIDYSKLNLTNSIQNGDIVANAITTSKVANGTVTTSKMADSAISGLKLLTYAVTTAHIADGAVTDSKVANGIAYSKLSGVPTSLPPSGAAGGNLSGTYPNPTIASLPAISGANLTNLNASNLASGTVPTARLGTGTANSTTYLRGDGTWTATSGNLTGSGTNNYITKWTAAGSTIGNSLIQDNGTSISAGLTTPSVIYQMYVYRQQQTINGDGQHSLFGYRTRDSQNDGTGYSQINANSAACGYNFWGDVYTFGVAGWNYNDYSRCGGTFGADVNGLYWGSLGYRSSGLINYGVYGNAAYVAGGGYLSNQNITGIGGGFAGGIIGSWSHGRIIGNVNSGDLVASYNVGNVLTSGYSADLINTGSKREAAYSVTSPELIVYSHGSAIIENQQVFIPFSATYIGMLSSVPDVTVSAIGTPAQIYIQSIEKNGFTVVITPNSINDGATNVRFSWIAVGKRVDADNVAAIPTEIADTNFDSNMNEVMFEEGNKEQSGKPIWWDGQKIRFDAAPEAPKVRKVEPKNR